MKSLITLVLLSASFCASSARLDPVIVTSKSDIQSSNLLSTHKVLDETDFEAANTGNAIESLEQVPGIYINQSGGPGAQASIYIRGSEVRHVLVLIDGVRANDPSNPDKQFNAANITLMDVEKIEVIKGAQSVLYGSDAIGGVVNIITKKGSPKQKIGVETGFQQGLHGSVSKVGQDSVSYFQFYQVGSEGISAKDGGSEKDGFHKNGLTFNHSTFYGDLEATWMAKIMQDYVEDDGFDSSYKLFDDPKAYSMSLQQIYKQDLKWNFFGGKFNHVFSLNKMDRKVKFFSSSEDEYQLTSYSGSTIFQDLNWVKKMAQVQIVAGTSHEYENFNQSSIDQKKMNLYSAYVSANHLMNRYLFNIGLRSDVHEAFGHIGTYNLGLGKKFRGRSQIKLNMASGFKAPTIYQLYVPYDGTYKVGNEDLVPEKSQTIDLTYSQMGKNNYQVTLFNNYIYDYFYYGSNGYENQGSFHSQGIEVSATQKIDKWSFSEGVTLAEFDVSSDDELLRRPEQKVDFNLTYLPYEFHQVNMNWRWVSARYDKDGSDLVVLKAYDLFNLSYQLEQKHWNYNIGINNLFDRQYQDVYGYSTLGRSYFFKLNYVY